jgi:hypothetical protein
MEQMEKKQMNNVKEKQEGRRRRKRRRKSSCGADDVDPQFTRDSALNLIILIQQQKEKRHLLADMRLSVCVCHAQTAMKITSYLARCGRKVLSSCDTDICVKS